jgi:hypothetical protein
VRLAACSEDKIVLCMKGAEVRRKVKNANLRIWTGKCTSSKLYLACRLGTGQTGCTAVESIVHAVISGGHKQSHQQHALQRDQFTLPLHLHHAPGVPQGKPQAPSVVSTASATFYQRSRSGDRCPFCHTTGGPSKHLATFLICPCLQGVAVLVENPATCCLGLIARVKARDSCVNRRFCI